MRTYKKFAFRGMIAGLLVAAAVFSGNVLFSTKHVQATERDCGASSILTCGAANVQEIIDNYNTFTAQGNVMQQTYAHFGIGATELTQLNAHAVLGTVYADFFGGHNVLVVKENGVDTVVATNVRTAGRVKTADSTVIGTYSGITTYERPYNSSNSTAKQVFVLMNGEKFMFGIMAECGNPVVGDTPSLAFTKEISKDSSTYSKNATFNDGDTATFRVTATETSGKGIATGVFVQDTIPAGFDYVPGSTVINGVAAADITALNSLFFGDIAPGTSKSATFKAKVHLIDNKVCGSSHLINTATVDSSQTGPISDTASADVTKACQPVTSCNTLTGPADLDQGQVGNYAVDYTATNTTVTSIVFSVDGTAVQTGMSPSYAYTALGGAHTISALVNFANGAHEGGASCQKVVTAKVTPKIVKCTSLTGPAGDLNEGDSSIFIAHSSDDLLVQAYNFTVNGVAAPSTSNRLTYKFTTAGTYTIAATLTPVAGTTFDASGNCTQTITVKATPKVVSCTALQGPASLSVNEQGTYTVVVTDASLVDHYEFTQDGTKGGPSATPSVQIAFGTAGTHTISALIVPKAGISAGSPISCAKSTVVNELPKDVACTSVEGPSDLIVGQSATFTALTTNENRVATYTWTGVTTPNGKTATVSFDKAGTYTVGVTITPIAGVNAGAKVTCSKTVNVKLAPAYTCDSLTLSAVTIKNGDKVTATVKYTATDGATFKGAIVDFGEAAVAVDSASNGTFTADYTYVAAKNYNVSAALTFMVNGVAVTAPAGNCAAKVTTVPV
jgi:uncharacterized repeat protein (TIGR01451 family)